GEGGVGVLERVIVVVIGLHGDPVENPCLFITYPWRTAKRKVRQEVSMPPEDQSAGFVGQAAETPPERIERQIRELKSRAKFTEDFGYHRDVPTEDGYEVEEVWEERLIASSWGELSEAQKLDQLDRLDWQGLPPLERLSVIEAEVDLTRVSPAIQRLYLGELRDQAMQAIH